MLVARRQHRRKSCGGFKEKPSPDPRRRLSPEVQPNMRRSARFHRCPLEVLRAFTRSGAASSASNAFFSPPPLGTLPPACRNGGARAFRGGARGRLHGHERGRSAHLYANHVSTSSPGSERFAGAGSDSLRRRSRPHECEHRCNRQPDNRRRRCARAHRRCRPLHSAHFQWIRGFST